MRKESSTAERPYVEGVLDLAIEGETVRVGIAQVELAGAPRRFPHPRAFVKHAHARVLIEQGVEVGDVDPEHGRTARALRELLVVLPLQVQLDAVAPDAG